MKIKRQRDTFQLKQAGRILESATAKILKLETSLVEGEDSEVKKFRKEFGISTEILTLGPKREKWYLDLCDDRSKFNRYQQRLVHLAQMAGFQKLEDEHGLEKGTEINTLEVYLITGEIIGQRNSFEAVEDTKRYHLTNEWKTASLARRVRDKLDTGKIYKEIAKVYNSAKPLGTPKVTTVKLRQIMSRAKDKLGKKITRS